MFKKLSSSAIYWEFLLGIAWLLIILTVNPLGEFPLNDDWAYSKSVLNLVNTGKFIMVDWPAMSLFSQVYWGGLFCSIFGFSFTILRFSTLLLGFLGILTLFKIVYKLSDNLVFAFTGALLFMVNPLYVLLSFSFMTDVPFTVFCIISIYFFISYLRNEKIMLLILALVFSVIATLTRQLGVLVPFAFGIIYFISGKLSVRNIIKASAPFIISIVALLYYNHWLTITGRMTTSYQSYGNIKVILVQLIQPVGDTFYLFFSRAGSALFYCAIFLLPLLIILAPEVLKKQKPYIKSMPLWTAGIFMAAYFLVFKKYIFAPLAPNVMYNFGMGPKLLKDSYILKLHITPFLGSSFWFFYSITGLTALFFLMLGLFDTLVTLIGKIKNRILDLKWKTIFFIYVVSFVYLGYLVFSYFFDRYFIFLVPMIIIVLVANYGYAPELKSKWKLTVFAVPFIIISFFSIAATHDYLSWNRARWKALDYLTKEKNILPTQIDGGFEFNLWNAAGPFRPVEDSISWWCVTDDEYLISFGKLANYKTLRKFEYSSMLPGSDNNIYLLHRDISIPEIITCDMEQFNDDKSAFITSPKKYQIPVNTSLSGEESRSGRNSIKLSAQDPYGVQFVIKNAKPGELFEIRAWKYSEENDVTIIAGGSGKNKFNFSSNKTNAKTADGWEQVYLRFYAPSDIQDGIDVFLMYTKQKYAYIDDLSIKVYHLE